ncbi:MAG: NAD-dependent deacylase [Thermodesulfobacteriota bacterium]|nr:NAD-dependent deacylase [Thermodesulfobacteriota bacterium]
MEDKIKKAAKILCRSKLNLALTGAGISVESGIPDFRSKGGLWERYDIREYGTISAFESHPEKVWKMLAEMDAVVQQAEPNPAHKGLGRLQDMGLLHTIITQNIDNLHQEGGASRVIEYHGNSKTLSCLRCHRQYQREEVADQIPPRCACGQILKPDVILFGESIHLKGLHESYELASSCGAVLVIGTSAQVAPANTIPVVAKRARASIIEINLEPTLLTASLTDVFLQAKAGEVVPKLVRVVEGLREGSHMTRPLT